MTCNLSTRPSNNKNLANFSTVISCKSRKTHKSKFLERNQHMLNKHLSPQVSWPSTRFNRVYLPVPRHFPPVDVNQCMSIARMYIEHSLIVCLPRGRRSSRTVGRRDFGRHRPLWRHKVPAGSPRWRQCTALASFAWRAYGNRTRMSTLGFDVPLTYVRRVRIMTQFRTSGRSKCLLVMECDNRPQPIPFRFDDRQPINVQLLSAVRRQWRRPVRATAAFACMQCKNGLSAVRLRQSIAVRRALCIKEWVPSSALNKNSPDADDLQSATAAISASQC